MAWLIAGCCRLSVVPFACRGNYHGKMSLPLGELTESDLSTLLCHLIKSRRGFISMLSIRFSRIPAQLFVISSLLLVARIGSSAEMILNTQEAPASHGLAGYLGSQSCNSVACHGSPETRTTPGSLGRQEFRTWTQHDPHADAAGTLISGEFTRILRRVSNLPDVGIDARIYQQCAACHDPEGISSARISGQILKQPQVSQGVSGHGIGCESCHGAAKNWIARHYQRGMDAAQLARLGMVETQNLSVRGQVCASCHIGGPNQDMNHDMIAAGHPPLRFELASYHGQLTAEGNSHWNDLRERRETPHFEVQLWGAGQVAGNEAALALLESRLRRASGTPADSAEQTAATAVWPEFAEYNCFACHQNLRPALGTSAADEGYGKSPRGTPDWSPWNFALTEALVHSRKTSPSDALTQMRSMRDAMNAAFMAEPAKAASTLEPLSVVRGELHARLSSPGNWSPAEALDILTDSKHVPLTWDSCCQRYLGLIAVDKGIRDELAKQNYHSLSQKGQDSLQAKFRRVREALQFTGDQSEWPRVFASQVKVPDNTPAPTEPSQPLSLAEVSQWLDEIAAELRSISSLPPQPTALRLSSKAQP